MSAPSVFSWNIIESKESYVMLYFTTAGKQNASLNSLSWGTHAFSTRLHNKCLRLHAYVPKNINVLYVCVHV